MLNQIVDFRYPEERMAARLVERLGLNPPIDVERLCGEFADLSFKKFPIEIDGLCLDLKVPRKRPKVWVSLDIARVRKRFTLAHEIGHIIIPWHVGQIVDDIEAPTSSLEKKYREIEAEANRFAAELLMPSAWVVGLSERSEHGAALMYSIKEIADVSYPAAFLKAAKLGSPGFVGAEVRSGIVVRSKRTMGTNLRPPKQGTQIDHVRLPTAHEPKIIHAADADYYWWKIREELTDHGHELPAWRDILDEILREIPTEFRPKTRVSINAIVGRGIGSEPRGGNVQRIFRRGLEETQNRDGGDQWVAFVISHDKFPDYVLARARARAMET